VPCLVDLEGGPQTELAPGDSLAWQHFVAATGALEPIEEFLDEHLLEPTVTPVLDAETVGLPADVSDFDGGGVACRFAATARVEFSVGVYGGTAEMLGWMITSRLGHGEVRAVTSKRGTAEGLLTLSPKGEPMAIEDVSWSAEPNERDYSFADDDCIVVRRAPRVVAIDRRAWSLCPSSERLICASRPRFFAAHGRACRSLAWLHGFGRVGGRRVR
jgi:hypothetical protein